MKLKIKGDFVLRTVAGETVALPAGGATDMDMMISLNDSGRFLWEKMAVGIEQTELVEALLGEYDVDRFTAEASVEAFAARLRELGFLA